MFLSAISYDRPYSMCLPYSREGDPRKKHKVAQTRTTIPRWLDKSLRDTSKSALSSMPREERQKDLDSVSTADNHPLHKRVFKGQTRDR